MKKLVLIDGNAIIHRAYHALPKTMTTRKGEPTNAVYGFTTTIIKVLEDLKPDYIAASFDLAGPTFRHEHFADYKATRVKADQELYDQMPRVKELVKAMNIPIYEKEGFEADDCIGTVVEKLKNKEIEIYIISGDKDIFQLINGKVKVYSLRKGLSRMQVIDHDAIRLEYGLQPPDFIGLKALAGDPSDNIPGVPGVGAKTATQLLQDFDTLDKLYEAIRNDEIRIKNDEQSPNDKILKIKPRILELLIKHKDQAFMSQKLATIHRDVPINFSLEECEWGEYDRGKLREFFEQLGFQSLLRRFGVSDIIQESQSANTSRDTQSAKDQQLKLL
jgi:DNA polymerase I